MTTWVPGYTSTSSPEDIMDVFHTSDTPLEAIVNLGRTNLSWLVRLLMCAPDGTGDPLILMPFQSVMLEILWNKKFPMVMACRGAGKTFMLAVYALLRAILVPGEEILMVGKAFRQSKKVFEYIEKLYNNSPLIKELVDASLKKFNSKRKDAISHGSDRYEMYVGLSRIIALPIGDGESIRGQRATVLLVDEFASVNEEVLEVVITPFLSVHKNPQKRAETNRFLRRLEELGAKDELIHKILKFQGRGNQMVISGTASSQFNHFFRYYLQYKDIINSRGDAKIIRKAMGQTAQGTADAIPEEIISSVCRTWRDYVIYQVPYTSVPEGYLDDAMVARNRLMFTRARFKQEYECLFPDDTGGFIPYGLIKEASPIGEEQVIPELYGEPGCRYVMGIDPARLKDYFGIVILKLHGSTARLVYAKSFYRREFSKIVPHIVDLTKRFNIVRILMDNAGGGIHVKDMLKDPNHIRNQEDMIFDMDDLESRYKPYGKKILQVQNFSNQWVDETINAMKSDIEHRRLLFPLPNLVSSDDVLMAQYARSMRKRVGDIFIKTSTGAWSAQSLEILNRLNDEFLGEENVDGDVIEDGIMKHIDETILETCAIEQQGIPGSQSVKYDLPKVPTSDMDDVRHRDRYTALLLASQAVRIEMSLDRSSSVIPSKGAVSGRPGAHQGGRGSYNIRRNGTMRTVDYSEYYKKMKPRRPRQ